MKITALKNQSYLTGFKPRTALSSLSEIPTYLSTLRKYSKLNTRETFRPRLTDLFPILTDRRASAGVAKGHYFHQDLWAARKIFAKKPLTHVDVGSRFDGFIAHLLVFMQVVVVDIRPLESDIEGLTFLQDDATKLSEIADGSVKSLSSLHVAEHFGLGRYSDSIDPNACFDFMAALERVLAPTGTLYFSVPIGRERVEFNAHRIFAPQTILQQFTSLELTSFSFVGDDDQLHENCDPSQAESSEYACGLFEFTKRLGESATCK